MLWIQESLSQTASVAPAFSPEGDSGEITKTIPLISSTKLKGQQEKKRCNKRKHRMGNGEDTSVRRYLQQRKT